MECELETISKLTNGTIFNDLERLRAQILTSHHYLTMNISETVRGTPYKHSIMIATYTHLTQGCHFEWPWVILNDLVKYSVTQSIARPLRQLSFLCPLFMYGSHYIWFLSQSRTQMQQIRFWFLTVAYHEIFNEKPFFRTMWIRTFYCFGFF